jgi:hypothetical protein
MHFLNFSQNTSVLKGLTEKSIDYFKHKLMAPSESAPQELHVKGQVI